MIMGESIRILLKVFTLLFILFVITGCEKLTASLNGLNKEEQETAVDTPVPVIEELETETSEDSGSANSVTGDVVADVEEPLFATHTVRMTADGFSPDKIYIKVGDTVVWKNTRSGNINKAMIIGVRECSKVRSGFFKPGESFSWTFDQPMTCTIADGIMTTKESKVFVE